MMTENIDELSLHHLTDQVVQCRKCPRLVEWREEVAATRRKAYQDQVYWGKPVPGFGDPSGQILIIGLAPGAHGSNRTGRMFTGDSSGNFLYRMLNEKGLANQPTSSSISDGLTLNNIFITAVGRCAPPDNKPTREEIENCRPFLEREMAILLNVKVFLALGKIAFDQIQIILKNRYPGWPKLVFSHGVHFTDGDVTLIASYHPSQQNTQTGRLTREMFSKIGDQIVEAANLVGDNR